MEDETNKPILKVGDKIRIKSKEWFDSQYKSNREDIEPPEEYNRPFFDFMEQYCGNICTIKYIYSNNVIKFNENDEDWELWMFDLVDEKEEKDEEPQYKAGDKIVINSIDWYNANKDGFGSVVIDGSSTHFIESMKEYCGEICTIKESFKQDNGIYYYLEELGYCWQSWMFSLAKKPKGDYQVGDRVQINSKEWYDSAKNNLGNVDILGPYIFGKERAKYCGDIVTIIAVSTRSDGNHYYGFKEVPFTWMSWMFSSAEWSLLPSIESSLVEDLDIGDEILTIYGTKGVILDVSTIYKTFLVTYDDYSECLWVSYDGINSVLEHGKYKDYIDTSESNWTLRRCDFRDKLKQLEVSTSTVIDGSKILTTGNKYDNSQSDSSKFDLSKVVYKSRRIK